MENLANIGELSEVKLATKLTIEEFLKQKKLRSPQRTKQFTVCLMSVKNVTA